MSIDLDVRIWNPGQADARWVDFLEMSPEDREQAEPEEQVEAVLEVMGDQEAPADWLLGRLAMLDLAFGQVGESLRMEDILTFETFTRFLFMTLVEPEDQADEVPSGLPLLENFEGLLKIEEQTLRGLILDELESGRPARLQAALDPFKVPNDYTSRKHMAEAILALWQHLSPLLHRAHAAGSWREEVFVIETVNGEVDHPQLLKRATHHAALLRARLDMLGSKQ